MFFSHAPIPVLRAPFLPIQCSSWRKGDALGIWEFSMGCNPATNRLRLWIGFSGISALWLQVARSPSGLTRRLSGHSGGAWVRNADPWAHPFCSEVSHALQPRSSLPVSVWLGDVLLISIDRSCHGLSVLYLLMGMESLLPLNLTRVDCHFRNPRI